MTTDSTVQVLLPLALEDAYTYLVPDDMALAPGDYVRVPLGPRQVIGVVWDTGGVAPDGAKLRAVTEKYQSPAMPDLHRQFIDWVAQYYLEQPGSVLRMALRVPEALGDGGEAEVASDYPLTGADPTVEPLPSALYSGVMWSVAGTRVTPTEELLGRAPPRLLAA